MKHLRNIFLLFIVCSNLAFAIDNKPWVPVLNFDIEGRGFLGSMIFISGHSYSLSSSNELLERQGKLNFFCKKGGVGSKELIDLLNEQLVGVVTAEEVTKVITNGLVAKYPCDDRKNGVRSEIKGVKATAVPVNFYIPERAN